MDGAGVKKNFRQKIAECVSGLRPRSHGGTDGSQTGERAAENRIDLVFLNDYGGPLRGMFEIEAGRKPSELAAWMLAIAEFRTISARAPDGLMYIVQDGVVPKHVNMTFDFIRERDMLPCTVTVDFAAGTAAIEFT